MSTFAVFGMTMDLARQEARKIVPTTRQNTGPGPRLIELTEREWLEKVELYAGEVFSGKKVKQISPAFDAPQFAEQFIELARKAGECRGLKIRARQTLMDEKGEPVFSKKTKAPRIVWLDYRREQTPQVA
jgi:hypothetical protein